MALGFRRREFIELMRQKLTDKKAEDYWYEEGMEYMTMDELLSENAVWKEDLGKVYSFSYKKTEPTEIYYSTRRATVVFMDRFIFFLLIIAYGAYIYLMGKGALILIGASIPFFLVLIPYILKTKRLNKNKDVRMRLDQKGVYIRAIHYGSELYGARIKYTLN